MRDIFAGILFFTIIVLAGGMIGFNYWMFDKLSSSYDYYAKMCENDKI